ncbi:uncharacterized protein B0I36DRAFT_86475 [Microdochium trichocladiopsis]|uniref:Uncharacterized protein n=1 Tax=Microdochium trichocladiopsis TaxID=1682393 RepID=A0A9P8YBH0_9PEZI|nr:uncharacterized protein B0I36DRAFT_86475 [Microdochium trichocladiopsis]KAH7034989.1 hypothetical protein B0I36DRAFT_86475 [Microdochium trichocladiopsis]
MCTTIHYRSRSCGHHWLQVQQACGPGMGFTYCARFGDGVAREPSPLVRTDSACPSCVLPNTYDRNRARMIVDIRGRWRWGFGPGRGDPGVECAVM